MTIRLMMMVFMINAMLLGFLSSSLAGAQLDDKVLICGPSGLVAVAIDDQPLGDQTNESWERCVASCLAAFAGGKGLLVADATTPLPELEADTYQLDVWQVPSSRRSTLTRARGPPMNDLKAA